MKMWNDFERTRPAALKYDTSREDAIQLFKKLQRESVPLECDVIQRNMFDGSYAIVTNLKDFIRALDPGTYLASAGQDDIDHCFTVVVEEPDKKFNVLDNFDDKEDPPVVPEPLFNFNWLSRTKWLSRVALRPGYFCRHDNRKSRAEKKRKRREIAKQQRL
ncbi:hypothetical protein PC121_g14311 [Phytophthora cactorum]|nr:hypothetical protein PC120_g22332 [Phytophthora cactorum]KAG3058615.1 hypothetical protein PC121_g14311 [Phytophthora cactorum]KAG4041703.1 hypothetical protein PC123_g22789 [Phytophthora cactorum]